MEEAIEACHQTMSNSPAMEAHRNNLMPSLVPQVGMEFTNSDVAWAFWLSYCGQKGFEVRKRSYQVGVSLNLSYTLRDHKNYLRTKWQQEMAYGQASSMLKYFQDKIADCPSFQYALQMDGEELIANILWVDAKMIADYARFGDVNAIKHLGGEKNEENNEDTSILSDFNACMYEYEDMVEFEQKFDIMIQRRAAAWCGASACLARHATQPGSTFRRAGGVHVQPAGEKKEGKQTWVTRGRGCRNRLLICWAEREKKSPVVIGIFCRTANGICEGDL
ncbi:hypothetical protein OsJ_36052 [Oryza sativa Japonica Group]|uniref:Uncharacterized protein n=1 Tax=Oryza sativa subsp. japonica TaxID=39947 RepID=B9GD32_ORYSJ|nr:hypothetical protein OsJ_36052 [Oryza sativa Japonica Group]